MEDRQNENVRECGWGIVEWEEETHYRFADNNDENRFNKMDLFSLNGFWDNEKITIEPNSIAFLLKKNIKDYR